MLVKSLIGEKIVDVSLGLHHTLALNDDGRVFGMGKNSKY